eukprot:COSAG06_NODE_1006_length_11107_cov_10.602017_11_plen_287_part_00
MTAAKAATTTAATAISAGAAVVGAAAAAGIAATGKGARAAAEVQRRTDIICDISDVKSGQRAGPKAINSTVKKSLFVTDTVMAQNGFEFTVGVDSYNGTPMYCGYNTFEACGGVKLGECPPGEWPHLACVRVRACVCTRYGRCNWRFSAPHLLDYVANRVASRLQALVGKVCYYVCVSAWRCGHLRAMDFVCDAFVCAVACTVACASPTPRHFNTCHRPTTTSAAGEPTRRRRRAPLGPLLLRALKSLRAPPSWAHFSVAFSQTVVLTFPIFTKPAIGLAESLSHS